MSELENLNKNIDFLNLLYLNNASMREKVFTFEDEMRKYPQLELAVKNYFSQGVYARELHIPKGVILTGKIHKYSQLNIMIKGDISVLVEDKVVRIVAPFVVVSPPGTKRIAYAHEDTIWITIHGTDEIDLYKIEDYFTVDTEQQYLDFKNKINLNQLELFDIPLLEN